MQLEPSQKLRDERQMTKRNLFAELSEGFEALKADREGKLTLKRVHVAPLAAPEVGPEELLQIRTRMHVSRAVFANAIRTKTRTLENWEQGRSKPNAQAALLIKLVEKYPETLEHLQAV